MLRNNLENVIIQVQQCFIVIKVSKSIRSVDNLVYDGRLVFTYEVVGTIRDLFIILMIHNVWILGRSMKDEGKKPSSSLVHFWVIHYRIIIVVSAIVRIIQPESFLLKVDPCLIEGLYSWSQGRFASPLVHRPQH